MRVYRLATLFACSLLVLVSVALARPASANCGSPALESDFAPRAAALEAMPLRASIAVAPPAEPRAVALAALQRDLNRVVAACPGGRGEMGVAPVMLAYLWFEVLDLQQTFDILPEIKAGLTTEPAACAGYDVSNVRVVAAGMWNNIMLPRFPGASPADVVAMRELPEYPHVLALWRNFADTWRIALPAPGSEASWEGRVVAVDRALERIRPSGLLCNGVLAAEPLTTHLAVAIKQR